MPTSTSNDTATSNRYGIPLLIILTAAGLMGNYFRFPIFLNIDFLFGSIFAILALQFLGFGRGLLATASIAGYTYILWNHPYAIIIMTAEVASIGWLMGRHKMGLVQADTLYWLFIGMPLVYVFYHLVMHVPPSNTYVVMAKQAVNGIANALIARLIFICYALWSHAHKLPIKWTGDLTKLFQTIKLKRTNANLLISYHELVYNLLAFFVLCPVLIILAVSSRSDFFETDRHIRETLNQNSRRVTDRLRTWVVNRKSAILNLAEMAATRSPQQMQSYLELAKRSDVNFQRVGLLDRHATTTAFYPLVDELGQKNIGRNFGDRPFIPRLKQTLKPMLSEVVMGRIGAPKPVVSMLAPVVISGQYNGYVIGVLGLEQIQEHLDKSTDEYDTLYTLLDKNGNVIMSNRTDQKIYAPFARPKGALNSIDKVISQWVPEVTPNTPISERWRKSFYIAETAIGDLAEWKLILEQPVAPFQKALYDNFTGKLTLLFLILLGALMLAELLSRKIVVTLGRLLTITYELPVKLATDNQEIAWPESCIEEANHLIGNFREMAESLSEQFRESRQINESLELRVEERTGELAKIMQELNFILENAPVGISRIINRKQVWVNRKTEEIFKYSKSELELQTTRKLYPSDEAYEKFGQEAYPVLAQGLVFESVQELLRKDGVPILVRYIGKALEPQDMSKGTLWLLEDITERRHAEDELRQAKAAAEAANNAKSRFLANMSHEIRTPMNGVIGLTDLLLGTELTEEQRRYADLVKRSGKHLVQLISDILDLSKIEAHKIELELREFDLQSETTGTINLLSLQAEEKGLELNFLIEPDVPLFLKGDAGRLRQIITNLVGNAIKFSASHERRKKCVNEAVSCQKDAENIFKLTSPEKQDKCVNEAVSCQKDAENIFKLTKGTVFLHICKDAEDEHHTTLRFLVHDRGIGIAADKLETIFEPFTQADSSTTRKYGGTGLGLTISRELAGLMGGTVGVESVEGEGSTFWFTAVLEKQPPPITVVPGNAQQNISSNTSSRRGEVRNWSISGNHTRLLLAEDDPTNQLVTKSILAKFGYQVDVANNGREALKMLENNDYALVLMDCMMPDINGYDATAMIRDRHTAVRNHAIPVIALTANAMREDHDCCLAAGMDDYLIKPLEVSELLVALERWVPFESGLGATIHEALETIPGGETKSSIESIDIFNRDEFVRRNLGDLELCRDVANIFFDHGQEYIQEVRAALASRDNEAIRQTSHKLKGAAANLALPMLRETAALIEAAAKAGDLERAGMLMSELEMRFVQAAAAVKELLPGSSP